MQRWERGALSTTLLAAATWLVAETGSGLLPDVFKQVFGSQGIPLYAGVGCLLALAAALVLAARSLARRLAERSPAGLTERELVAQRGALIAEVEQQWMRVLDRSLEHTVRVELGFSEQPDAVADQWAVTTLREWRQPRPLPPGTTLRHMFQRYAQRMLVLGGPGAGKSTQLLELTRNLLPAATDSEAPIPVVLLLSRWPGGALRPWVVSELETLYRFRRSVSEQFLEEGRITLILDGLDEVPVERRLQCAEAISAFTKADGCPLVGVVVSCRIGDYADLDQLLSLNGAVEIAPLSSEEVRRALRAGGAGLEPLYDAAVSDLVLTQLLDTPLMLSVAVLAYRHSPVDSALATGSLDARRAHLFDVYVSRMLIRDRGLRQGTSRSPYEPAVAWRAITRLALIMEKINENVLHPRDPFRGLASWISMFRLTAMPRWRWFADWAYKWAKYVDLAVPHRNIRIFSTRWSHLRCAAFTALGAGTGIAGCLLAGADGSPMAWAMAVAATVGFGAASGTRYRYEQTAAPCPDRRRLLVIQALRTLPLGLAALGPFALVSDKPWSALLIPPASLGTYFWWLRLRAVIIPGLVCGIVSMFLMVRLGKFLAYADDRILMRRVGDGYQYLHATLREHLWLRVDSNLPEPPREPELTTNR
jgi:hypothetical protein